MWRGRLEGVAVCSRAMPPEEAAADFAAYSAIIKAWPVPPRVKLQATLAAKSDTPSAKDIAPYREALVVYEYNVSKVLEGKFKGDKVRVVQWGLIDAQPAAVTRVAIGTPVDLVLEPFADHPQLEAEMRSDTLPEDFDVPLYADVANGPAGQPRLTSIRVAPQEAWVLTDVKLPLTARTYDQYFNDIPARVKWSVRPGGSINSGTAYGAGAWFTDAGKAGEATVDANGVLTGTTGT